MLASYSPQLAPRIAWIAKDFVEPLGRVFLRLVIMVVVPLVVSALILGILELGDLRNLGRVGLRTLSYTVVMSLASVIIGVGLVNTFKPGSSLPEEKRVQLREQYKSDADEAVKKSAAAKTWQKTLLDMLPENPIQEMVGAVDGSSKGNGMLAVMFFSLIVGVALTLTRERTGPLIGVIEGLFDVSMTIIGFAMKLAPLGVGCLIDRLAPVIVRHCPRRSWRANYSAILKAPLPMREVNAKVYSSKPTVARCSWMKSVNCRYRCKSNCCECWNSAQFGPWVVIDQLEGYQVSLFGGFTAPPKPLTTAQRLLMDSIESAGERLGRKVHWQASGGVCDGNRLAAAGLPNIDTLGPVGENLHSPEEWVDVTSIPERASLVLEILASHAGIPSSSTRR